jgi:hypothetical protein
MSGQGIRRQMMASANYKIDWFAYYRYQTQGDVIGHGRWNDAKAQCPILQDFETFLHEAFLNDIDTALRKLKLSQNTVCFIKAFWDVFQQFCRLLVFLVEDPVILKDLNKLVEKIDRIKK